MEDVLDLVANQQRAFSPTPLHLDGILGWQNWRCQGCQGCQGARARGTHFFADQFNSPFPTRWSYFALNQSYSRVQKSIENLVCL